MQSSGGQSGMEYTEEKKELISPMGIEAHPIKFL